jgi:cyclopropane-fatty-acyl-phospholipid synthase
MFELYLTGAEMTFRRLGHMVWQIQLARQHSAVPLTRDYITEAEWSGSVPQPAAEGARAPSRLLPT